MSVPRILAETPRWLAVFKPAGWLSIPGRDPAGPEVLSRWAEEKSDGKIWVVHRLDRETSGVLLFARTAEDHRAAGTWFQNHEVKKLYDCLAAGVPTDPVFKVSLAIEEAPSTSQVEVKERFREGFLARVRPVTGRRHQIRIHLSKSGYPIWGDTTYGGAKRILLESGAEIMVPRVALHAARLELPTQEVFEAEWPEDFGNWVRQLRMGGHRV